MLILANAVPASNTLEQPELDPGRHFQGRTENVMMGFSLKSWGLSTGTMLPLQAPSGACHPRELSCF